MKKYYVDVIDGFFWIKKEVKGDSVVLINELCGWNDERKSSDLVEISEEDYKRFVEVSEEEDYDKVSDCYEEIHDKYNIVIK